MAKPTRKQLIQGVAKKLVKKRPPGGLLPGVKPARPGGGPQISTRPLPTRPGGGVVARPPEGPGMFKQRPKRKRVGVRY